MEALILIPSIVFLTEFGAFIWHKMGAHTDLIPKEFKVQETHDFHHTTIDDQAHFDFLYILIFLIIYGIFLGFLIYKKYLTLYLASILYLPVLFVSIWNWYIHMAYHVENHWLNSYEWFRNDKRIHLQHHFNPETNFGIASHLYDVIFETFDYGLSQRLED